MDILRKTLLSLLLVLPLLSFAGNAVDINAADMETLMSIKGIGEKRAAAIIAYREQHGSFKSVEELSYVKGVSGSLVEKNRDSLSITSPK